MFIQIRFLANYGSYYGYALKSILDIIISLAAGVSLSLWCYKVRQISLRANINRYQQV